MDIRFTTKSGSRYLIKDGYLHRCALDGAMGLGDKIVANSPIAEGAGVYFVLESDTGETSRVRTTPVAEVFTTI